MLVGQSRLSREVARKSTLFLVGSRLFKCSSHAVTPVGKASESGWVYSRYAVRRESTRASRCGCYRYIEIWRRRVEKKREDKIELENRIE